MLLKNMAFKVTMIEQRVRKLERCFKLLLLDAWGWCTGTTQSEGMGKYEGGGFRMGNTGIPVADSFRYFAKLIQYCKV